MMVGLYWRGSDAPRIVTMRGAAFVDEGCVFGTDKGVGRAAFRSKIGPTTMEYTHNHRFTSFGHS